MQTFFGYEELTCNMYEMEFKMKKLILMAGLLLSNTLWAQTDFSAVLNEESNSLTIVIRDNSLLPPHEAGELWSILKGVDYRKSIRESGFNLDCYVLMNGPNRIGDCSIEISMDLFQKIGNIQVLKLKGTEAAKLNRYFLDSAYLRIQSGKVYLSSYNTRREFFFGIEDSLIQKSN